ncbi:MAG: hypothetical protein WCK05_16925, partial [Planctomycetota bacterium]
MSSRRNNSNEWNPNRARRVWGMLVAAAVITVALLMLAGAPHRQHTSPLARKFSPHAPVQDLLPGANPIERMLAVPDGLTRVDGIAVAVPVDVSGSMGDTVPGASGRQARKIDIARTSLVNL